MVKTSGGQHSDGIIGFHKCRGSLHCRKTKSAAKMLTMFIVTITNHSTTTIHLWTTIRSNVTAKDVLPRVHAMIAKLSPILHKRATWIRLFGVFWTISRCCPKPRVAATWQTAAYATRQHYQGIEVSKIISSPTVTKREETLTIAAIAMPSSQPNTLRMYTRTYKRIKTKTKGTIDIVHITPFTVGAWLSIGRCAPPLDDILSVRQRCAESQSGVYRKSRDSTSPDVGMPRMITRAWDSRRVEHCQPGVIKAT